MIGFGFWLWLKWIGEIEYGFKMLLLGGFILMLGMYFLLKSMGLVFGVF